MKTKIIYVVLAGLALLGLLLKIQGMKKDEGSSVDISLNTSDAATPHDYFNQLITRSDLAAAYSLRNPAQLQTVSNGGYAACNACALAVTYTYPNDPDPRQQDAAKVEIPMGKANLPNQVRLPIPTHAPQSLFITWDGWFGKEWIGAGIPDQKTWQIASPATQIHTEIRNRYAQGASQSPGSIALIDGRQYPAGGYSIGPNITTYSTLGPMVGKFFIKPETWTRWFAYLQSPAAGDGTWYDYSLWAADATTGPTLIYDRLKIRPNPSSTTSSWESFWLEFNTSSNTRTATSPPLIAYVRNVVMLKGTSYSTVQTLLQKPGSTGTLPPPPPGPPPPPPPANVAPTVSLTSPTAGQTFSAPATINLAATAADSDGFINKVEFYNGSTLLGSDTTTPYTFSWTNVAAGSYSLTAKAIDSGFLSKVSTAVSITVSSTTTPPPPPPTSTLLPGDLNGDKIVNSIDWSYMNSKWLTTDVTADINKDGIVNTIDFSIMNSNWLKTSP